MNRMARQDIINLAKNIVVFYCNKRYFNNSKINKDDVDILKCSRRKNIRTVKLSVTDNDKIRYFKVKYNYYTESTSTYEYKTVGKVRKDDVNELK